MVYILFPFVSGIFDFMDDPYVQGMCTITIERCSRKVVQQSPNVIEIKANFEMNDSGPVYLNLPMSASPLLPPFFFPLDRYLKSSRVVLPLSSYILQSVCTASLVLCLVSLTKPAISLNLFCISHRQPPSRVFEPRHPQVKQVDLSETHCSIFASPMTS